MDDAFLLGAELDRAANRDVRVISPNVDVPVQGSAVVGGTLQSPTLDGTFRSTGGTVSFLRDFRIRRAEATFAPSDGIVPTVDAVATAYVADPSTNVTLRVTGPATGLNVAFSSDPPYDREQILGLLVNAQAIGAVRGVSTTGGTFSASSAVTGLAAGQLNQVFTRNLLEPLSLAMGEHLGLTNLQLTSDVQAGLGVSAAKAFGNNLTFIFAQSFNETRRTSWTLQARPSVGTQLQLTAYTTQSVSVFALSQPPAQYANGTNLSTVLLGTGTNGVDFKLRRCSHETRCIRPALYRHRLRAARRSDGRRFPGRGAGADRPRTRARPAPICAPAGAVRARHRYAANRTTRTGLCGVRGAVVFERGRG